jgi:hypothetical protein
VAKVTIPRATIFQPAPPATILWWTSSGAQGAKYVCAWATGSFRVVELEQDCERGVNAFTSYNTGSLPSGGPARTLTVAGAYAEAGIQMLDTGGANIIATPANHTWNNASLHHAMQTHFSRWAERPQFKVWLLHAMRHEYGVGLRGIHLAFAGRAIDLGGPLAHLRRLTALGVQLRLAAPIRGRDPRDHGDQREDRDHADDDPDQGARFHERCSLPSGSPH